MVFGALAGVLGLVGWAEQGPGPFVNLQKKKILPGHRVSGVSRRSRITPPVSSSVINYIT
jgi:hypothetical protein